MMDIKLNYIIIPLVTLITAIVGRYYTASNMQWYHSHVHVPSFTPPDWMFGVVWQIIYALTTAAALIVWNTFPHTPLLWLTMFLFLVSAVLNVWWTYLFFHKHFLGFAFLETLGLIVVVYSLFACIFQQSFFAALLIIPYAGWITFAAVINYRVWRLNAK